MWKTSSYSGTVDIGTNCVQVTRAELLGTDADAAAA